MFVITKFSKTSVAASSTVRIDKTFFATTSSRTLASNTFVTGHFCCFMTSFITVTVLVFLAILPTSFFFGIPRTHNCKASNIFQFCYYILIHNLVTDKVLLFQIHQNIEDKLSRKIYLHRKDHYKEVYMRPFHTQSKLNSSKSMNLIDYKMIRNFRLQHKHLLDKYCNLKKCIQR